MNWSDLPRNPSVRTLRQFAGLWILFFTALAGWEYFFRHRQAAALSLAALGLTMGPLGLWRPGLIRPIYVGWLIAAFPIGWTVSRASLAIIFYLVVTPLGLVSRLLGRDRLSLRRQGGQPTRWSPLGETRDVRRYFRQF